jgi:hypothetical protein
MALMISEICIAYHAFVHGPYIHNEFKLLHLSTNTDTYTIVVNTFVYSHVFTTAGFSLRPAVIIMLIKG